MDDTSPRQDLPKAATGLSSAMHMPRHVGMVTVVSGFKLTCMLFGAGSEAGDQAAYEHVQIGDLIKVPTATTTAFGLAEQLHLGERDAASRASRPRSRVAYRSIRSWAPGCSRPRPTISIASTASPIRRACRSGCCTRTRPKSPI